MFVLLLVAALIIALMVVFFGLGMPLSQPQDKLGEPDDKPDQYGFRRSNMTERGWEDYQRYLRQIEADRDNVRSRHGGINRVHCRDGYVDVIDHRYADGSCLDLTVDELRDKVKGDGNSIYDYNYGARS